MFKKMLQITAKKIGIDTTCSKAEELPFLNSCFERVIVVDALHHVKNQKKAVSEMWRVLKPGGRLVIEEPDIRHWLVKIIAFIEKITLMQSNFLAPPEIKALFSEIDANVWIEQSKFISWIVVEKK